jgi:3-oxoacyl-(acyl-carrier-protein) synthase
MSRLRVAISGCGGVASNGIGREAFAEALREGRSGIGEIVSFDASDTGRERAAEIRDFSPEPYLRSPKNYLDRNSALAFAACEMAVRESGAELPDMAHGCGIAVGTMSGDVESLAAFHSRVREKGAKLAPPFLFPHTYYNTTLGLLSIEYGLNGPHNQFCSGGAAGLEAIAWAAECIALGRAPLMIAGGVEAFSEPLFRSALARGWLSPLDGGEESCKPFAADRNGTILGEGAAFFVLEPAESAKSPLALIEGMGIASMPEESMRMALADASVQPKDVACVLAAAGGYPDADEMEEKAIHRVFTGTEIDGITPKGAVGETFAAGGPLALAAALSGFAGPEKEQHRLINAGGLATGLWISLILDALSV